MLLGGSAALSSWLHAHPGRFLTGQFILYLRRFSGFADRTIISEVLKAAPAGVPVVFIASPQNQPRNWDPFVWAFSGLRLRHPVVSVPVQLRTPDEDWESVIARLIANAGIVVIDRTESSDSVAKEIRLVGQHASPERTIWLVDLSKARSNVGQSTASHHEPGQMVAYRHRWVFLSMTAKIGLFLFASGVMVSMLFPGLVRHEIDSTQVVTIAVVAGLWLICGAVVLIRPSIDREARQRLRESLALAVTAPSQPRDAWTAG